MVAEFGFALLVFLLAVAAPFALYVLVSAETDDLPVMDRMAAERVARRDVDDADERD
ncbi:hypothetical protein SAMN04487948_12525 [Halogranum amylolyticum]|uniref:Uncharacterized protein n=1 Tax=Halogranum amylolyticum TaxID=660520 RepID=A0A1H8W886_9EURY|nr:hypothetical protein [Halogranum amylolyticum]SEP23854.1 hypothetical protein SAMN04487948_12525 [Halogranum amylolyticum]